MIEEDVARFFHVLLTECGIENSADVRKYPKVAAALEHSSKNGGKNIGKPDVVASSSGIYILIEYKHHTKNQVSYDKIGPGPNGYKLSSYWDDIKNKAENGAVHYLMDMVIHSNGAITEGFAVGISMDDDESFIIRPYYYRESMERPVRLPCMIDFSDFRHNRIKRLKEYAMSVHDGSDRRNFDIPAVMREFDRIAAKGGIHASCRPYVLAMALAAMANQRFSPTLLLGNDDAGTVLRYATGFVEDQKMFTADIYERTFRAHIRDPTIGRSIRKGRNKKDPSILRQMCECLLRVPTGVFGRLLNGYIAVAYGTGRDEGVAPLHLANLLMEPTGADRYLNPCCFMESDLGYVRSAMDSGEGSKTSEPKSLAYSMRTFVLTNLWAVFDKGERYYIQRYWALEAQSEMGGKKPSVIVADMGPYFHDSNDFMDIVPMICGQLKRGGRAAFVIPWDVMTSNRRNDAKARDALMREFRLDAVVKVSESAFIVCVVNSKPPRDHTTILYDATEEGIRPLTWGRMFFSRDMPESDHWARARLETTVWWQLDAAVAVRRREEPIGEDVDADVPEETHEEEAVVTPAEAPSSGDTVFHISHYSERVASGVIDGDGFRVLKGSRLVPRKSIQRQSVRDARRDLKRDGTVRNNTFREDWSAGSVRMATSVIIGTDHNSPLDKWVTDDGRRIREFIGRAEPEQAVTEEEDTVEETGPVFVLNYHGREVARGYPLDGNGFRVLAGSELLDKTRHLVSGNEREYDRLIAEGVVVKGRFVTDWDASSPSRAASVVLGSNYSGLPLWRTEDGTTLKEYLSGN